MTRSTSSAPGQGTKRPAPSACRRWSTSGSSPRPGPGLGLAARLQHLRSAHEEYAVQRWPETKRLLAAGHLAGCAHGKNALLVQAARKQDRCLAVSAGRRRRPHRRKAKRCCGARMRNGPEASAVAREPLRNSWRQQETAPQRRQERSRKLRSTKTRR